MPKLFWHASGLRGGVKAREPSGKEPKGDVSDPFTAVTVIGESSTVLRRSKVLMAQHGWRRGPH